MTVKFKPSYDYILIEPLGEEESITRGGIIIPTSDGMAKAGLCKGKVLGVGDGVPVYTGELVACKHKKGDMVLYADSAYGFVQIYVDGKERHLIKDQSILGVFDGKKE